MNSVDINTINLVLMSVVFGCAPKSEDEQGSSVEASEDSGYVVEAGTSECGWEQGFTGAFGTVGQEVGATIVNMEVEDQCEESATLWDFAGEYHILFMTMAWCGTCLAEARELPQRNADWAATSDIPFSYMIILAQDTGGVAPDGGDAFDYMNVVDVGHDVPVLSDINQKSVSDTSWDGRALPGKCVVSPEMEILDCYTGHGDDEEAFALIRQHYSEYQ